MSRSPQCILSLLPVAILLAAQDPNPSELARRAVEEQRRGDLTAAVRDYRRLLALRPDAIRVRTNLAVALTGLEQFDEAIQVLESAPPSDRQTPEIRRMLALAYHRSQRFPEAIAELEKLNSDDPNDLQVVALLADAYSKAGQKAQALALLKRAAAAHPADPNLQYQLGAALVRGGHPEEGVEPLERAGKLANNADAWMLAGATALDLGWFQRARDDLETALRLNPSIPGVWTWNGMARDRVNDEEGAKAAFGKALEADPRDFEALFHLGAILYRERDLKEARKYLERALAIQPVSLPARYAMALVRSASGELDRAVRDIEGITAESPDWVEPHAKLATLYFKLHRPDQGKREMQIVESLEAAHKGKKVVMPELDRR